MDDLFAPTVARMPSQITYMSNQERANQTSATGHEAFVQGNTQDNYALGMEDFLQLMIVQFQNQDIENPASTSEMMNQLMQMSTIQAMATMTDASTMTYASSLVGKTVTVGDYKDGKLVEIVGQVTGSATYNGNQVIFVDNKQFPITSIMAVGTLPPKEDEKPAEGGSTTTKPEETEKPEAAEQGGQSE